MSVLPFEIPSDWEYDDDGVLRIPLDQAAKANKTMPHFDREDVLGYMAISKQLKAHGVNISAKALSKFTIEQIAALTDPEEVEEDDVQDES